jgi:hypothetical protein
MSDLAQYGILGIVVAGLCWYILHIEKRHKEERAEWKQAIDRQFDKQNETMRENTGVLSSLKTIIENMKR